MRNIVIGLWSGTAGDTGCLPLDIRRAGPGRSYGLVAAGMDETSVSPSGMSAGRG